MGSMNELVISKELLVWATILCFLEDKLQSARGVTHKAIADETDDLKKERKLIESSITSLENNADDLSMKAEATCAAR